MFKGCTKLSSVTCLATVISAEYCTTDWLDNAGTDPSVTSRQFFTPSTTAWENPSVSGIPENWTRVGPVDLASQGSNYVAQNGDILTGTLASSVQISIADGATVVLDNLSINADGSLTSNPYAGITCSGDATIVLSGTNTVKGMMESAPGIKIESGKTLTLNGTGSLTVSSTGGGKGAGIGGWYNGTGGNLIINGGTITASSNSGAGIGSSEDGSFGTITINGGTIVASSAGGAGIGAGLNGSCGNITITGGSVTATNTSAEEGGAGIGGGLCSSRDVACGDILISGGTVTATGGGSGAGIGAGYAITKNNTCGTITITNGITQVQATRGSYSPGIIGASKEYDGGHSQCGTITIDGVADATTASSFEHLNSALSNGDKTWTLTPKTP